MKEKIPSIDGRVLIPDRISDYDVQIGNMMMLSDVAEAGTFEANGMRIEKSKIDILNSELPESAMFPIFKAKDQDGIGHCVAFAVCRAVETLVYEAHKVRVDLSELFTYSQAKLKDPWRGVRYSGTSTIAGCLVARDIGICHENLLPWAKSEYVRARDYMLDDAEKRRVSEINYLSTTHEVAYHISKGHPVVLAIKMFSGFRNKKLKDGVVVTKGSVLSGSHAICLIGHKLIRTGQGHEERYFCAANSWGSDYGKEGHVWIPESILNYRYSASRRIMRFAVALEGIEPDFDVSTAKLPSGQKKRGKMSRFRRIISRVF